jgi:hypothetical protein
LLEVSQNTSEPKASSVKIRQGTQTASIKYDETLIRVRSAAASNGRSSGAKQPQPSKPRIIKSVLSKGIVQPTTPSKGGVVRPVRTRYTPKTTKP